MADMVEHRVHRDCPRWAVPTLSLVLLDRGSGGAHFHLQWLEHAVSQH